MCCSALFMLHYTWDTHTPHLCINVHAPAPLLSDSAVLSLIALPAAGMSLTPRWWGTLVCEWQSTVCLLTIPYMWTPAQCLSAFLGTCTLLEYFQCMLSIYAIRFSKTYHTFDSTPLIFTATGTYYFGSTYKIYIQQPQHYNYWEVKWVTLIGLLKRICFGSWHSCRRSFDRKHPAKHSCRSNTTSDGNDIPRWPQQDNAPSHTAKTA